MTKKNQLLLVGGDQGCESLASTMKRSLHRFTKMGRWDSRLAHEHVAPMACLFLPQRPGIESLICEHVHKLGMAEAVKKDAGKQKM